MENLKGFKPIPGYTNYLVNVDGIVVSRLTGRVLRPSINGRGYLNYTLTRDTGQRQGLGQHRAVALAFLPTELDTDDLVINHIDGDKTNNTLSNLEWVTYKANAEHAGRLSLTTRCVPVSIRDTQGVVKSFPSFLECAKYLNLSKDAIAWRARKCQTRLCRNGYQYATGSSIEEWPELDERLIVIEKDTGKLSMFDTKKAIAEFLGISPATVTQRLKAPADKIYTGNIQMGYAVNFTKRSA